MLIRICNLQLKVKQAFAFGHTYFDLLWTYRTASGVTVTSYCRQHSFGGEAYERAQFLRRNQYEEVP